MRDIMKRIKVKLVGKGTEYEPFTVDLPTWTMDGEADYKNKKCYVTLPEDETEDKQGKTKINQQRIRTKYKKGWSKFKASDVEITE